MISSCISYAMNNGQYSDATGDQCSHQFAYAAKLNQVVKMGKDKPEFAAQYPQLEAGVWEPAAEMGAKVLLWQVQQQGTAALATRILDERHFEFRGGWYRGNTTDLRTRASDPAFNGPV